ncbi:MAG: N-acetylmuramoyl-L-alanine amidase-like domain-containing protein [Phycisphaerae bacterium]
MGCTLGALCFLLAGCCGAMGLYRQLDRAPAEKRSRSDSAMSPGADRDLAALRAAPLYTFTEAELDAYLKSIADDRMPLTERVAMLGRKTIGQPYQIYLLGEAPVERLDPDPLYRLDASDCVTFVEQTYAMALAHDWPSFFETLQRLRYEDGQIGFLTRNHFTEADWNIHNAWLFEDVTTFVAPEAVRPMRATIDRAAFFRKHGVVTALPVEQFESRYVPREALPKALDRLRTGDVIEFVRGDAVAQYVGHIGLCIRNSDGRAMLLHSAEPAVREEPLLDYVSQHANILGIKVLRPLRTVAPNKRAALPGGPQ